MQNSDFIESEVCEILKNGLPAGGLFFERKDNGVYFKGQKLNDGEKCELMGLGVKFPAKPEAKEEPKQYQFKGPHTIEQKDGKIKHTVMFYDDMNHLRASMAHTGCHWSELNAEGKPTLCFYEYQTAKDVK